MQRLRWIVVGGLVLVGVVWIGQGLGFIPGSFMTGDPFWAVAGAIVAVGGLVIFWSGRPATR